MATITYDLALQYEQLGYQAMNNLVNMPVLHGDCRELQVQTLGAIKRFVATMTAGIARQRPAIQIPFDPGVFLGEVEEARVVLTNCMLRSLGDARMARTMANPHRTKF